MIETKEQYENLRAEIKREYEAHSFDRNPAPLWETIEALREVARAADWYWKAMHDDRGYVPRHGYAQQLRKSLEALPDWIKEDAGSG